MNRTERLYKIQRLLDSKRTIHISEFLKVLEVSRATFRRDLDYMRDRLGIPIEWNRDTNGYKLDGALGKSNTLPGLWFTEPEIHALFTITQLLSDLEPNDLIASQIRPLLDRLESIIEAGCSDNSELTGRVRVLPIARRKINDRHFGLITSALIRRVRLDVEHYSRQREERSTRQISPQQLVYYRDNWYLDAFCHLRDDLRSFSVDTIENVSLSEKAAVSLPKEELQRRFRESYGIFTGNTIQTARLRFTPFRARWVAKEIWHPKQRTYFDEQGFFVLEIPFSDARELILDILRQGPDCEVLQPESLRQEVARQIQKTAALYRVE